MASVGGFFKGLGHILKVAFTSPTALKVEAGIVGIAFPGFGILATSAANAIISAEGNATAAGVQNGTGTQKLVYALSQFGPVYDAWAKENNVVITDQHKQVFLQKIFDVLQVAPEIEAVINPTPTPAPSTTSPSA